MFRSVAYPVSSTKPGDDFNAWVHNGRTCIEIHSVTRTLSQVQSPLRTLRGLDASKIRTPAASRAFPLAGHTPAPVLPCHNALVYIRAQRDDALAHVSWAARVIESWLVGPLVSSSNRSGPDFGCGGKITVYMCATVQMQSQLPAR